MRRIQKVKVDERHCSNKVHDWCPLVSLLGHSNTTRGCESYYLSTCGTKKVTGLPKLWIATRVGQVAEVRCKSHKRERYWKYRYNKE
jgi:hypothetical protein